MKKRKKEDIGDIWLIGLLFLMMLGKPTMEEKQPVINIFTGGME